MNDSFPGISPGSTVVPACNGTKWNVNLDNFFTGAEIPLGFERVGQWYIWKFEAWAEELITDGRVDLFIDVTDCDRKPCLNPKEIFHLGSFHEDQLYDTHVMTGLFCCPFSAMCPIVVNESSQDFDVFSLLFTLTPMKAVRV